MAAVAGLRGSGDWGTDERPTNFREFINFRNPNGTTPIFGLMARVQKESVDDPQFSWWDEQNDIIHLVINGALTAARCRARAAVSPVAQAHNMTEGRPCKPSQAPAPENSFASPRPIPSRPVRQR